MTLTSGTCVSSCIRSGYNTYPFCIADCNSFWEINYLGVFPYKSTRNQNWPLRKKVKGQPGVIIWTNLVVLECPWCCIPSFSDLGHLVLKKKSFKGFYPFYHIWAWRPSWSCDQDCLNKLSFPHPIRRSIWNLTLIGLAVSEEMFKERGRRRTTTTDEGGPPILSPPMSLRLRWAGTQAGWNQVL